MRARVVCSIAGAVRSASEPRRFVGTGESTMDTLLIILLALTTVAIPVLTEIAAAAHIFDAWGRADFA